MDRAHSIVTEEDDMRAEKDYICSSLKKCGYPDWTFRKNKANTHQQDRQPHNRTKRRNMVTISYVKGISEAIQRVYQKYDVSIPP